MKRILVTGCSSGIGRAIATQLASEGHAVIATARRVETLHDLPVAEAVALDVTDQASVDAAIAQAGEVDVLINNAGVAMWGPLELNPIDDVERLFDTNVIGAIRMTKAVLPAMRARRSGRIVQISSGAARRPQPLVGLYCASKAALESFSMALRLEMRAFGVTVATVGMGAIASNIDANRFVADATGTEYEGVMQGMFKRVGNMRDAALPAEEAARVVSEVVNAEDPPFRTYVGQGFAEGLAEMAALSDQAYEDRLLKTLHAA